MTVKLWEAPTQPFKTTLDGRLAAGDTTMALVSTTGLSAPGILLVHRQDGNGSDTPDQSEYISFTGVLAKSVTGLGRALGGTIAKDHGSGTLVECFLTSTSWGDMIDFVGADHDSAGKTLVTSHLRSIQVTGVSGISGLRGGTVFVPISGVSMYASGGASTYPWVKLDRVAEDGGRAVGGVIQNTDVGEFKTGLHLIEETETLKSFSLILSAPASTATLTIDLLKNRVSMFDAGTKPIIPQGGTYVSTASLATKTLSPGNYIHLTFS